MKPKPELHVVGTSLSDARWYEHRDTGECNITTLHFRTGKDAVAQIIADSRGGLRNLKKPVY